MNVNMGIFKAYDIRGVYPDEINQENVKLIANATAHFLDSKTLIVGQDVRISSETLKTAVVAGIVDTGCDVIFIGQCTTPMFYFAVNNLGADGGIMITASHNLPKYNGLKVVRKNSIPVGLDTGLAEIRKIASDGYLKNEEKGERKDELRMADEYIDFLLEISRLKGEKMKLRSVVDTSQGAAAIIMQPLLDRLGIDYVPINFEIDGTFSKDDPNPLAPHALEHVSKAVLENKADLGMVFDGDGDRLVVVDEKGAFVDPQFILTILWQKLGGKVVHDLRFSRSTTELFGNDGVRSKVGHNHIAAHMLFSKASVGGETSGHVYFKEMNGRESSALAALRLLSALKDSDKPLSKLVAAINKYSYSGEINIEFHGDFENVKNQLKEEYHNFNRDELDGLTIDSWGEDPPAGGWWFNLRPSNTEPVVRLVLEAKTEKVMIAKIEELKKRLGL